MRHGNIFIFLNNNKLSFYTYQQGEFTHCHYKGDSSVYVKPDSLNFFASFWAYMESEFISKPWEQVNLSILYHKASLEICQNIIAYPCSKNLLHLRIECLEMALPQLLCKMDILKQEHCLVCFEDSLWNVTPYEAYSVHKQANLSPYKLREDEIIKAYLGAFPVQGVNNIQPANNISNPAKSLNAWIESSSVEAKPKTFGEHHE